MSDECVTKPAPLPPRCPTSVYVLLLSRNTRDADHMPDFTTPIASRRRCDVRFWHLADIPEHLTDVRL
jgi:hypothetical protein